MTNVGEAYVVIRPDTKGFSRELTQQASLATAAAGQLAGEQFVRGADGRLRDGKGRFVKAGEALGAEFVRGADGKLRDTSGKFVKAGDALGADTVSGFSKRLNNLDLRGFANKLAGASGQAAAAIAGGLAAGGVAVAAIGTAALKASSEFNASMSGVAAVSGATAGELASLREAALDAGAATVFSASEAATAQEELAKAGISTSEILNGALTGSLALAAAGQLELGEAATISAQAMNVFGLGGEDVTGIADVLAAAANKSATDVGELGFALRQGGLVAAQTGLSLEETTGVLALFADNALIGSDAGTSLKTMLQRLTPQSAGAAEAMEELGLKFYDAQGAFVGIDEVAQQLQDGLGGLSEEQRNAALQTLFGADAVRGASLLMKGGRAAVEEYTAAVNDQGAAARVAGERLNNLQGDLEAFRGSIETALIRAGDLVEPTTRLFVQGATDSVNAFNEFAGSPVWSRIQFRLNVLGSGATDAFAGVNETLERFLGSISVAQVDRTFDSIERTLADFQQAAKGAEVAAGLAGAAIGTAFLKAIPGIGALVPAFAPLGIAFGGLILQSDEGRAALGRLGERAAEVGSSLGTDFLSTLATVSDELGGSLGVALESIGTAALDAAAALSAGLLEGVRQIAPVVGELVTGLGRLISEGIGPVASITADLLVPAFAILTPVLQLASDIIGVLADNAGLLVPALAGLAAFQLAGVVSGWAGSLKGLGDVIGSVTQVAATRGVSNMQAFTEVLKSSAREGASGLAGALGGLNLATIGVTAAITAGVAVYSAWSTAKKRAEGVTKDLADALLEESDALGSTYDALSRNLDELGVTRAAQDAGLSVRELSKELRSSAGDFDEFRGVFQDAGESFNSDIFDEAVAAAEEAGVRVPDSVFKIKAAFDAGLITDAQAQELLNALVDTDKATGLAADNIVARFGDIRSAAGDLGIDIGDFRTRFDAATGNFDAQKAVLDDLIRQFPELGEAIGITGTSSEEAATEVRGLIDALAELAGGQLAVDKATQSFTLAQESLLQTLFTNGKTLDQNTAAGARNRQALDRAVESAFALAEAQAQTDASGKASTDTLNAMVGTLTNLFDESVITEEQYHQLLTTYGLTPDQITTTIDANTADAKAKTNDLRERINALPGVSKAEIAEITALVDKGDIKTAQERLNALERTYAARVTVTVKDSEAVLRFLGVSGQANGSVLDFYANGGMRENHVAQIAPAGAWRVWAEPETGGEAYIPLAASKRRRSLEIWAATGRRLGVMGFAEGGITTPAQAPAAQGAAPALQFNGPVTFGGDSQEAMRELDWYAKHKVRAG